MITSRLKRRLSVTILIAAIGCADDAPEPESRVLSELLDPNDCFPVANPMTVRQKFVAELFPDSATDTAFLCGLQGAGACPAPHKHLDGVISKPAGQIPTRQQCVNQSEMLQTCDRYAKHLITTGLESGGLGRLLEGVTRLSELMAQPFAPPHYDLGFTQNAFAQWLATADVDPTDLGECTSGTPDDQNFCLAAHPNAPSAGVIRGLGMLLEQHNGVLVRAGQVVGSIQRQANIFASMTGPVNVHTARTDIFMPEVGPGVQYPRALGPVFGLRLLTGAAGDPQTELEMLADLDGYDPEGPVDIFSAGHGILSAQARAYGWDPAEQKATAHDLQMVEDLRTFFIMLRMTAKTAEALGDCLLAREVASVYTLLSKTSLIRPKLYNHPGSCPNSQFVPHALSGIPALSIDELPGSFGGVGTQVIEDCQMVMVFVSVDVPEIEIELQHTTSTFTASDCRVGASWPDLEGGRVTHCECTETLEVPPNIECKGGSMPEDICIEYSVTVDHLIEVEVPGRDDYESWEEYGTEDLPPGHEVEGVLEASISQEFVTASYRRLLSSDESADETIGNNEDVLYHHPDLPDETPDLNFDFDGDQHVSIVNAGVNWQDCQEELVADQETYAASDLSDDLACTQDSAIGSDCTLTALNDAGLGGYAFVPFAVAQRVCPKYTAKITGVLDNHPPFNTFGVSIPGLDYSYCTTPYAFTKAVEHFLSNEPTGGVALEDLDPELAESRKEVLTDFANETLLLVQPAAAMYRQRATFAGVVGDVAASLPGVDSSTWFNTHAGLDNYEAELLVGEAVMADGLRLLADFNSLTLVAPNETVEVGTRIIADDAVTAYAACSPNCAENSRNYTRARFHLATRDSLETYRALSSNLLEVQWRRFGGVQCFDADGDGVSDDCGACVSGSDTDGDGLDDLITCNGTEPACADKCAAFDSAGLIVESGSAVMTDLHDLLEAHDAAVAEPNMSEFIVKAADFAESASNALIRDHTSMLSGIDWLGFKEPSTVNGTWFPGHLMDPDSGIMDTSDVVRAEAVSIQDSLNSANYDPQVDAYLEDIRNLTQLVDEVDNGLQHDAQIVETYCDGPEAACDSEWKTGLDENGVATDEAGYVLVGTINQRIREEICGKTIELHYHDGSNVIPYDPAPSLANIAPEDCPVFLSPNLDLVLPPNAQGAIPNKALEVEILLRDVEVWLNQVAREVEALESADYDRTALLLDEDLKIEKDKKIERIVDSITCGVAIIGAVVCTVATYGSCAAVIAVGAVGSVAEGAASGQAIGGAIGACANAFGDDILEAAIDPKAPTAAELEQAFHEYGFQMETEGELLNIAAHLDQLVGYSSTYSYYLAEYGNLQTAYDRSLSIQDNAYNQLMGSVLFNPTHQFFDENTLQDMEIKFETLSRKIRKFHHLIAYDLGQPVIEGGRVSFVDGIPNNAYELPSLNEITIVKHWDQHGDGTFDASAGGGPGAEFTDAYVDLDVNGADLSGSDLNLAAYASLLYKVWSEFEAAYDHRSTSGVHFIGSAGAGMRDVDENGDGFVDATDDQHAVNQGEAAMLGTSPFYDPTGYADEGCAVGEIDLRNYCTHFSDPVTHVLDTTAVVGQSASDQNGDGVVDDNDTEPACLPVGMLEEANRYSLTYLDFMVKSEDAIPLFECNEGALVCSGPPNPTDGTCPTRVANIVTPAQGTGPNGGFSELEVYGCTPSCTDCPTACSNEVKATWDVSDDGHYAAQTKTVQAIFDRYRALESGVLDSGSLNVDPGTYLWFINMSPKGAVHTNSTFDPELSLIVDTAGTTVRDPDTTFSEQLVAMGLICSDGTSCGGLDGATFDTAQVVFPGPGYLADRCVNQTYQFQQERVRFDMDAQVESHLHGMHLSLGATDFQGQVEAFVEEHRGTFKPWPLHTDGLIVGVNKPDWRLYRHGGVGIGAAPRIRLALLYSYYSTDESSTPYANTAEALIQCVAPTSCVKGHCP